MGSSILVERGKYLQPTFKSTNKRCIIDLSGDVEEPPTVLAKRRVIEIFDSGSEDESEFARNGFSVLRDKKVAINLIDTDDGCSSAKNYTTKPTPDSTKQQPTSRRLPVFQPDRPQTPPRASQKHRLPVSHPGFKAAWTQELSEYVLEEEGVILLPHSDVELEDSTFLKILKISQEWNTHGKSQIRLQGHRFRRNGSDKSVENDLACMLAAQPNELCWAVDLLGTDTRDWQQQAIISVPIESFERVVNIQLCNLEYPKGNTYAQMHNYHPLNDPKAYDHAFICRWKAETFWPTAAMRSAARPQCYVRRSLIRLRYEESDDRLRINDNLLMESFRGTTVKGGDQSGYHEDEFEQRIREQKLDEEARRALLGQDVHFESAIGLASPPDIPFLYTNKGTAQVDLTDYTSDEDVEEIPDMIYIDVEKLQRQNVDKYWEATHKVSREGPWLHVNNVQRYTFGDAFCGMGGASRAAMMAGLRVAFGVDKWEHACDTYRKNFPGSSVAYADVFLFIYNDRYLKRVDILHISNPCQVFSKCHTVPGIDDERNAGALHAIEELLRRVQPRIVTLENADGLATIHKNWNYLQWMITQFTMMGYSVRVAVLRFSDYGAYQRRARTIIIAACPGQKLPDFPEPTHDEKPVQGSHLRKWATGNDALSSVPDVWLDHDPSKMKIFDGKEWNGDQICRTLTTANQMTHPAGFRKLSVRELATIQTFPLYVEFGDGQSDSVKEKQVGNAIPPKAFAKFLENIKNFLRECDGLPKESAVVPETRTIIELDQTQKIIEIDD